MAFLVGLSVCVRKSVLGPWTFIAEARSRTRGLGHFYSFKQSSTELWKGKSETEFNELLQARRVETRCLVWGRRWDPNQLCQPPWSWKMEKDCAECRCRHVYISLFNNGRARVSNVESHCFFRVEEMRQELQAAVVELPETRHQERGPDGWWRRSHYQTPSSSW